MKPVERVLKSQFRFTISVDRPLRTFLVNRHRVRHAVGRATGREDNVFCTVTTHGGKQVNAARDVGPVVELRVLARLGNERLPGEMEHAVDGISRERVVEVCGITQIPFHAWGRTYE